MAEAFLNQLGQGRFETQSAGLELGVLNPLVVESMKEVGLDISHHKTKSVAQMIKSGQTFDYVITVCDETSAERCPVFPGPTKCLHWSFPDPSQFTGTKEEKLQKIAQVREAVKTKIAFWINALR